MSRKTQWPVFAYQSITSRLVHGFRPSSTVFCSQFVLQSILCSASSKPARQGRREGCIRGHGKLNPDDRCVFARCRNEGRCGQRLPRPVEVVTRVENKPPVCEQRVSLSSIRPQRPSRTNRFQKGHTDRICFQHSRSLCRLPLSSCQALTGLCDRHKMTGVVTVSARRMLPQPTTR